EFLVPVCGSGCRLRRLLRHGSNVFVLLVEGLGYRFRCGEDWLILGESRCERRDGLRGSFSCRVNDRPPYRLFLRRRLLRPALVLGNRFSGQQDWLVAGRRTRGLESPGIHGSGRNVLRRTGEALLGSAFGSSLRSPLRTSI